MNIRQYNKITLTYNTLLFLNSLWILTGLWLSHDSLKKLTALSILLFAFSLIAKPKVIKCNLLKKHNIIFIVISLLSLYGRYYYGGVFGSFSRSSLIILMISLSLDDKCIMIDYIKSSVSIGIIINFAFILYSILYLNITRPDLFMNPNIYAPIFGLFFLFFMNTNIDKFQIYTTLLAGISLYSVIAMQSRGVAVSSLASGFLLLLYFFSPKLKTLNFSLKKTIITIIVSFSLILTISNITYNLLKKTAVEYSYIKKGHLDSSIGQRIQMFLIAKDLIIENPVAGHGSDFKLEKENIINKKQYSSEIKTYKTLHNVYTDSWAKLGILGLLTVIYLTALPYLILKRTSKAYFGLSLSIFTFLISMVDTALLGGEYLLASLCICYIYKLSMYKPNTHNNL